MGNEPVPNGWRRPARAVRAHYFDHGPTCLCRGWRHVTGIPDIEDQSGSRPFYTFPGGESLKCAACLSILRKAEWSTRDDA